MTWNNLQWKLRRILIDCYQICRGGVDKDVTIFCNNCIGAFVAHDFRLPFNSPTVNLMIPPKDFIEYISHLSEYENASMEEIKNKEEKWPVALLGGKVRIHFIHYKTFADGVDSWRRREKRINKGKMYFIMVETDGCTYEDLRLFDNLPYQHKIALTHLPYPLIKSAICIKGYEKQSGVIDAYRFHKFWPMRKYDQINWLNFLKQK